MKCKIAGTFDQEIIENLISKELKHYSELLQCFMDGMSKYENFILQPHSCQNQVKEEKIPD